MKKKALIFGVTGQDGSYLSELLLEKNYIVHGVKRRISTINTERIDHIYKNYPHEKENNFITHYGDLLDSSRITNLISTIKPDEVYNLSAQSHVKVSFDVAEYTSDVNGIGTLRILEAIKTINKKIKFYQAGTSEMFGKVQEVPQNEKTEFYPQSPYAASKLFAHWITKIYRNAYNIHASNGILFNHESPRRGETFVTKKVCRSLCEIKMGKKQKLLLGNIYAKRDWGHAKEYVEAMWKIVNQKKPNDFVIATNTQYTVKEFINLVCKEIKINLIWKGRGINEKGIDKDTNKSIIEIDKAYFRPLEVEELLGDYSKAKKILKWKPKIKINSLVKEMVNFEMEKIKHI